MKDLRGPTGLTIHDVKPVRPKPPTPGAEIQTIEELREVLPRSGFRKQPPEFVDDEAGQQIPNVCTPFYSFL
jgi:hypothetical protein